MTGASSGIGQAVARDAEVIQGSAQAVQLVDLGGAGIEQDVVDTCVQELLQICSFGPDRSLPKDGGRMGLAFACDTPQEVDEVYDELVQAGYDGHKAPWDAVWDRRYAIVHDPDGNSVDLFAPCRPSTRHPKP